jgi:uncharacterized protein DUF2490
MMTAAGITSPRVATAGVRGTDWSLGLALVATLLMCAPAASAQTTTQLWGNLTFNWVKSDRLVYELDFEPKALLSAPEGEPDWRNLDVTPNVEYSLRSWLDLVADTTIGRTMQSDDLDSTEVTPRLGVRFHLFSRAQQFHVREQAPRRRLVFRDLVRIESRNFFYSGGDVEFESTFRFRNRLEFLMPINKERITDDGAWYWLADWEWFVPLDDPEERFASRQRIRGGIGYRRSFKWRYELLYVRTRSRNTIDEAFSTSENIIDVRVKRLF